MLHPNHQSLQQLAEKYKLAYQQAQPFPHICIDDFFETSFIQQVAAEFPDLASGPAASYRSPNEWKLASRGDSRFSPAAIQLAWFLQSNAFLAFLQQLTGIEETLLPDPYFEGGGYHEIKSGGYLKVHADFNKHKLTGLDRRLNVIVYLNADWEEAWGGHFEIWDKEMKHCAQRFLPILNRLVTFSTTSNSYHGHPDPLTCPADISRRSFAVYYYTNGRPAHETDALADAHGTLFKAREGVHEDKAMARFTKTATVIKNILPPILFNGLRKLFIKD
jgi:Rps23 Pro-64 3,4-dihydroxylase Tpa1-like proline 4-hydroxylase